MNNQNNVEYPYGQFPTRFTKNGQQQLIEKLSQPENDPYDPPKPIETNNQPSSNLNLTSLLPLIKMMGNKKNISQTDMLQMFLPMMTGNSNVGEILSLLKANNSSDQYLEEDIIEDGTKKIDEYVKIN